MVPRGEVGLIFASLGLATKALPGPRLRRGARGGLRDDVRRAAAAEGCCGRRRPDPPLAPAAGSARAVASRAACSRSGLEPVEERLEHQRHPVLALRVDVVEAGRERLDDPGDGDLAARTPPGETRPSASPVDEARPSSGPRGSRASRRTARRGFGLEVLQRRRLDATTSAGASGSPSPRGPRGWRRPAARATSRLEHVRQLDAEQDQGPREVEREDREEDEGERSGDQVHPQQRVDVDAEAQAQELERRGDRGARHRRRPPGGRARWAGSGRAASGRRP